MVLEMYTISYPWAHPPPCQYNTCHPDMVGVGRHWYMAHSPRYSQDGTGVHAQIDMISYSACRQTDFLGSHKAYQVSTHNHGNWGTGCDGAWDCWGWGLI